MRTATLTETSGNIHSSTWSHPESRRTLFFLQFSDTFPFIPCSFPHTIMYIQSQNIFPHLPSLRRRNQFRTYRYPKYSNLAVALKVRYACVLRFLLCSVPTTLAIFVLPQSILPSISISK